MTKQIKEAVKADKELCPHCNKYRTNLSSYHLKICLAKKQVPERDPIPGIDDMSNTEFLSVYKKHILKLGTGTTMRTIKNYQVYVNLMIKTEEKMDKDFKAVNWFANHKSAKFIPLREPQSYIPQHYGDSSVKNFLAAYRILHNWIRKGILDATETPLARHDRLGDSINMLQKKVLRGKFRRAKKKDAPLIPTETQTYDKGRLDPALVQNILDSYLSSEVME